jgi:hypothetical protein
MSKTIYSIRPNLILGFHGCDMKLVRELSLRNTELRFSSNGNDWLGDGIYFWENNVTRALDYAKEKMKREPDIIKEPAVIGAVIHLKNCLDLTDRESLLEMEKAYEYAVGAFSKSELSLPKNKKDMLLRPLDCTVTKFLDQLCRDAESPTYDSIRGSFFEGDPVYSGAGIYKKNHIQLCIRNSECILGYFIPRI